MSNKQKLKLGAPLSVDLGAEIAFLKERAAKAFAEGYADALGTTLDGYTAFLKWYDPENDVPEETATRYLVESAKT